MARISIAIPTHQMENRLFFLRRSLDAIWNQTMQDIEIVVTDNSEDNEIERMCEYYGGIKYFRNPRKGMAQNTNEAILHSTGELIKILYLDDYLAHNRALEEIWNNFSGNWLVTGCEHSDGVNRFNPHIPKYSLDIKRGVNTIGSPSVLTIKNTRSSSDFQGIWVESRPFLFDEKMTWLLDCDYYARMYQSFGPPVILEDINVVIGLGAHQLTNILTDELKQDEQNYLTQKRG